MRRIAIVTAPLLLICGTALAADFRPPPYPAATALPLPNWNGFYIGVNAGGGIATGHSDFSVAGGAVFASVNNSLSGALGGGQIGYNWQSGSFVYGVETDFQASGLRGGISTPCAPGFCGLPLTASFRQEVPWFGTVRGRLGYAAAGWMIYGTGGFAYGQLDTDASATAGAVTATFSARETLTGWTAGGGIEVALAPSWSAKIEYLYLDLGDSTRTWVLAGLPAITDNTHLAMSVVRAGVNFRF
jgi:outer membrane immunogenic protein